jgi:ketosteroid isomerase-like protein
MNYSLTETRSDRDLVLGVYGALATGELEAARSALHPDITLHVPGTHPLAGLHVGVDAFFGFVLGSRRLTEDGEDIEVLDVLEGEHHVGVYCTVRATRVGRAPLENPTIHLVRIRDGLVAEIWLHNFDDLSVNDFWS